MIDKLKRYNQKRNFNKTSEPSGRVEKTTKSLRFVVQHHLASRDHYDFRLEWRGALKSWAVPKGPSYNSDDKRLAVHVEDHPLDYRNFEGIIPKGQYGGGTVMIWDEGTWEPLDDPSKGLNEGSIKFILKGKRLNGKWALVHMKENNWLLIKEKDRFNKDKIDIAKFTTSIRTGRTMDEIEQGINKKKIKASTFSTLDNCLVESVKITSPDKIIFENSKTTKEEIALYYQKISSRMLPFLKNRIISTIRCPEGINGTCFFKKHLGAHNKGIGMIEISSNSGKEDYYYIKNVLGIISEVQLNTIEFHTWGSSIKKLEKPDIMVFDLDPDEKMDLKEVRQGVKDLKSILDDLSLVSFLKTSGGKGYHIVVPMKPSASWESFREFAKNIAKVMEEKWPERYVSNVRKINRKNRIFVDWIRNTKGATSVAPYSIRIKKNATVSMPIAWKELDTVSPDGIDMAEAIKRLRRKDPWANFFEINQQLN